MRKFPLHLLDISLYENSRKTLLQLQLNAVSFSRKTISQEMFYVNIIRTIAWDRKENQIILEVEGFGDTDWAKALRTAFYLVEQTISAPSTKAPIS
jgi:hypothetical protein